MGTAGVHGLGSGATGTPEGAAHSLHLHAHLYLNAHLHTHLHTHTCTCAHTCPLAPTHVLTPQLHGPGVALCSSPCFGKQEVILSGSTWSLPTDAENPSSGLLNFRTFVKRDPCTYFQYLTE